MEKIQQSLNEILALAEAIALPMGLCVLDARFAQSGKRRTLEVTIHRKNGAICLDDCENVSRALERALDDRASGDSPLIQGAYLLEVQSPGLDRQLKSERDFQAFVGRRVLVQAKERVAELGDRFTGTLYGVEGEKLTLTQAQSLGEGKKKTVVTRDSITLDMNKLAQVRLYFDGFSKTESTETSAEKNN